MWWCEWMSDVVRDFCHGRCGMAVHSRIVGREVVAADETICDGQGANDDEEESDDVSVDRRDRTSEAGTSGSGSDEDEMDDEAEYASDARERMGEASTSGREREPVLVTGAGSSRVINTVEVKHEMVEAKLVSKRGGAAEKACPVENSGFGGGAGRVG